MGRNALKKGFAIILSIMMILTSYVPGLPILKGKAAELTNPWLTLSNGGNEVNEIVDLNGKKYVRLGSGEGNDNGANAAIFREANTTALSDGTMAYTFIPETEGKATRFGFYPHFKDSDNFVFVGYDSGGWFYQYKYQGQGDYLKSRPAVALPEPGSEHKIKIDYSGRTLNVTLDGIDLFGNVTLNEAVDNLQDEPEAVKLGKYSSQNSQVLFELGVFNPWVTISTVGKEINEVVDQGSKIYTRLGSGEGNDNGAKAAIFKNEDAVAKETGTMEYTFVPETEGKSTRFGFYTHYKDSNNFVFIGYDSGGWFWQYKYNGQGTYLQNNRPKELPEPGNEYKIKIDYSGTTINATLNGAVLFNNIVLNDAVKNLSDAPEAIKLGQYGTQNSQVLMEIWRSDVPDSGEPPVPNVLKSDYMEVDIDEVFPRIIAYRVGDKLMHGQETPVYGLKVNGRIYYPEVAFEKAADNEALYTLTVKDEGQNLDAVFKLSLKVNNNQVIYSFIDINNAGSAKIETIEFPGMNFISVNAGETDAKAKLTGLSGDVTKPGDLDVTVDSSMTGIGSTNRYYTAFLSNNQLSAGVWSSSEVNGYGNVAANRYENTDGAKAMGISSNLFYYHREFMPEPQATKPTVKIAIAEDINDDKQVDWQDGAIVYRDIMQEVPFWQGVNDNAAMRIAMNFGSQAQQPFLKTLDNIKKVALATDGLGQSVLLKGYANEGHDSAHPDYGDVGERMGGAQDLNTLIDGAHQLNTQIGVHINAQEAYPEADAFNEDFIDGPNSKGWGWLDLSYTINKLKDLYSGTRAVRLDQLKAAAPGLDFVYLDVWYQDQWESNRITEQFVDRGWRLTTEFGTAMPNTSTWQHWAVDKNYGGAASKGINSDVLRFISNHQKDSWVLNNPNFGGTADNPLLGGFELAGFEGWGSDRNFDNYIRTTFDTNMPTKFLQKYYITNWTKVDGDPTNTNLEKEIKLKDPSNGDVVVVTRKDNSRDRVITLNGQVVLDEHAYLLPWTLQDFKNPTPDSKKLYHWNLNGGTTTWTLPDEYKGLSSVYVYKLTDQGRKAKQEMPVVNQQITINAVAATPYVIVPGESKGVQIDEWSTDGHIHDTGFNTGTVEDEFTTITGDKEAVSVIRTSQTGDGRHLSSGDYYLNIDSPTEQTSVSRTITDLEPGKDYVAEVYIENNSDVKASIQVTGGEKDVSNSVLRSLQKNYVKADSHASADGYNSKMQRIQISFTAKSETALLTLSREVGTGNTEFDDIRIVQKTVNNYVSPKLFVQDFESVVQGIYPFVIGNIEGVSDNRTHLSEKHAPYTQKGWANAKLIDDVLGGNWSVKTASGNAGLLYRTIPQHFAFKPGVTYKVSFDYQTTAGSYRIISGDQEIDVKNINDARGLSVNDLLPASTETKTAEITVKGSENGQTYIGIFNDGSTYVGHTGEGAFIMDNLRIEEVSPELIVQDATIKTGEELDIKSLITVAKDSKGNDVKDSVIIDQGMFDANKLGNYTITFTLHEEGFKDIVQTATVKVEQEPILTVKDATITAGEVLDLSSLITLAQDSKGNDVTGSVNIDKGSFDANTPGTYTITYTLKLDGFDDVVQTATVIVNEAITHSKPPMKKPILKVRNATSWEGDAFDLTTLIVLARDSEGDNAQASVLIDKGEFDINIPGTYNITFTLKQKGFKDIVETAFVMVKALPRGNKDPSLD